MILDKYNCCQTWTRQHVQLISKELFEEKSEDTKGVIGIRKSKNDKLYNNSQQKKGKQDKNDLLNHNTEN